VRLCFDLVPDRPEMVLGLEVRPLVGLESFHPGAAIQRGGRVEIEGAERGLETETGWPMELVRAHLLDAAGAVVEVRLAAIYLMGYHGGLAIARIAPERFDEVREAVVQVLRSARPSFRTAEPISVGELFEMAP
jgi:hypothetical protein